jgi:hypothetical protein
MNFYREAVPFGNTGAAATLGKNKGVLLTNTTTSGNTADLVTYRANGSTAYTRVLVATGRTEIYPVQIWGISLGSGWTGAVLS